MKVHHPSVQYVVNAVTDMLIIIHFIKA